MSSWPLPPFLQILVWSRQPYLLMEGKAMIQTGALGCDASPNPFRSTVSLQLMPMDYPFSQLKASLCLENLPVDILIQIQKHLDGRDIIVLRKVYTLVFYLLTKTKLWGVSVLQKVARHHSTTHRVAECGQTHV